MPTNASRSPRTPNPALAPEGLQVLATRVQRLQAHYRWVQQERMQDVPILHPRLHVQAIGFEPVRPDPHPARQTVGATEPAGQADQVQGVLITPWFMSLVHMPLYHRPTGQAPVAGLSGLLRFGQENMPCLATPVPGLGTLWMCSLYSPMQDFDHQAQALETAQAILDLLRGAPPAGKPCDTAALPTQPGPPSRRAFLMGRA